MILNSGTILYRGACTVEKNPQPRLCNDTMKFGIYMSTAPYHPLMLLTEKHELDYYISVYELTENIKLSIGKSSRSSHYDSTIYPIDGLLYGIDGDKNVGAEVFLTSPTVRFIHAYRVTTEMYYDFIKYTIPDLSEDSLRHGFYICTNKEIMSTDMFINRYSDNIVYDTIHVHRFVKYVGGQWIYGKCDLQYSNPYIYFKCGGDINPHSGIVRDRQDACRLLWHAMTVDEVSSLVTTYPKFSLKGSYTVGNEFFLINIKVVKHKIIRFKYEYHINR